MSIGRVIAAGALVLLVTSQAGLAQTPDEGHGASPSSAALHADTDIAVAAQPSRGQVRGGGRAAPPRNWRVRLSGHAGITSFTASDSFEAVLGTSNGPVYGGGAGVLIGRHLFVDVQVSRFSADGERAFVTDALDVFPLGIPATVTTTPVDVSVGWRFAPGPPRPGRVPPAAGGSGFRPVPFVGGGIGLLQYEEVSDFGKPGDDVSDSHSSYHVLGGLELPITRTFGASVDALYRWVPDALGEGGVSAVYGDTDLGGLTFRVRVTVTF